ncbi:MAG: hypothetical protein FJW95_16445 [Actinobacteria bacterium]|nr:hypothetical protein [Actinomycetota bacterium]
MEAPDTAEDRPLAGRGRVIEGTAWGGNLVFAATAVPAALGVDALEDPAIAVCLGLFFVSLVVWTWALGAAAVRTANGDDISVFTLFLIEGRAPGRVRWSLYGALLVCLAITVATAATNPFGVLVPMLPLGLVGLWGARHQHYPRRRNFPAR